MSLFCCQAPLVKPALNTALLYRKDTVLKLISWADLWLRIHDESKESIHWKPKKCIVFFLFSEKNNAV